MCGIVGTVSSSPKPAQAALEALAHRGPDGRGDLTRGSVWLGHRRLSIIDLTDAAAQPMEKPGCGAIVFNGELYDHQQQRAALGALGVRFDTRSDTEVLLRGLAARGIDFLRGVHGMYAFAWLEPSGQRLWLARDHAGMKPLYLWRGDQGIAFASEVRSLGAAVAALGGQTHLSGPAATEFLSWGSVPEPLCILAGAQMVPADCAVAVRVEPIPEIEEIVIGRVEVHEKAADKEPIARMRAALGAAVERHLVADAPVALFLSGGIDSGVLAAEIRRAAGTRPGAVTVVLNSRGTADEPELARRMATRHGLAVTLVSVENWKARLSGVVGCFDQPSVDGLNTYLVAAVARELGYKVALSGLGADEVFGGYRHLHKNGSSLLHLPGVKALARIIAPALAYSQSAPVRRVGMLLEGRANGVPAQRAWRRVLPESVIRTLLPELPAGVARTYPRDPLELEQKTYLRDQLLRDADVMGMAHGVEIRAPYLDPEVLSEAASIGTSRMLGKRKEPKWILREGWARDLEPGSLRRTKTGFTLDVAGWLLAEGRDILEQARSGLEKRACINPTALKELWSSWRALLDSGHPAAWVPLFALVQLEEQLRRWGEPVQ